MHACIYVSMHACMYLCMHAFIMYLCMYMYMYVATKKQSADKTRPHTHISVTSMANLSLVFIALSQNSGTPFTGFYTRKS